MMGFSSQKPEASIQHAGGWQHRYNIEQVERATDDGPVTEWQFDYINTPIAPNTRDYLKLMRDITIAAPIDGVQVGRLEDRENIKDAIRLWETLGDPPAIPWILADNTTRLMSKTELQAIETQYAVRQMQTFGQYQQLCEDLETSDEPESVVWS